jgi:HSP20 family molecular chaperone IbpA
MIRELGETIGNTVVESVGRAVGRTQEQRPLSTDLLESDDAYLVVFDAPGVEEGDAQVRFEDNTVMVQLDRFRDFHEGFEMRFPGRGLALDGEARLPDDAVVDPSAATATVKKNGTLQIRIPKVETDESDATDAVDVEDPVDEATESSDQHRTAEEHADDEDADGTD